MGTSLLYRRDWWAQNPFPEIDIGSDTLLIYTARRQDAVVTIPCNDLMFARVHPGNTNTRAYTEAAGFIPLGTGEAVPERVCA